jgi:hypothetical protein
MDSFYYAFRPVSLWMFHGMKQDLLVCYSITTYRLILEINASRNEKTTKLLKISAAVPEMAIRTTLIVGYPGETGRL